MLNKELLLASQGVVDPKDFLKHSYFTVALKPAVTRATGSNTFQLSFVTPLGIALDKYEVKREGSNDVFIPVEKFTNIPFDLSELVGYSYSSFNEQLAGHVSIEIEGVNSGIVPYNDVFVKFTPNILYLIEGDYFYDG